MTGHLHTGSTRGLLLATWDWTYCDVLASLLYGRCCFGYALIPFGNDGAKIPRQEKGSSAALALLLFFLVEVLHQAINVACVLMYVSCLV